MNFFETIYKTLQENPEQELITWKQGISTGLSLSEKISGIKKKLLRSGARSTEEILVATSMNENLIASLLAIMAAGATPILCPAQCSTKELLELINRRGIKRIVVDKISITLYAYAFFTSVKIIESNSIKKGTAEFSIKPVLPHQSALISHSSGTSGKTKAIYKSHKTLFAQYEILKTALPSFEGQVDSPLMPEMLLHNLATGTKSVLPDIDRFILETMDPARIIQQIKQARINTLTGCVYYFTKLSEYCLSIACTIPEVKMLSISGSPVPEQLLFDLKLCFTEADIYVIYGLSEAEPIAIRKFTGEKANLSDGYCVGQVIEGLEISFDNKEDLRSPLNTVTEVGEITIKGKHVASSGESLKTGDWGYIRDGELFLTGRKGNEKVCNGIQHYQIEHVLQHVTEVRQAAAVSNDDVFDIYYTGKASENEVQETLNRNFKTGVFRKIICVSNLPVDKRHHSKILYEQLR